MSETVLIVSATAPVPVDNGKRVVLHGLLDYFVHRLGPDNVHYALLGQAGSQRPPFPGIAHRLDKPGSLSQLITLARRFPTNRSYTIQEAMLGSRALSEQIRALVAWLRPTVEVYDTLRLGQHAPAAPRASRRVLYLDDLFSVRYERMLTVAAQNDFTMDPLGQFADFVPAGLRSLLRRPAVYRPILRLERDRIRRREVQIVRSFDASLLVNAEEVELLRERSGVSTVRPITPLLRPVTTPVRRPVSPPELVFLGRLNIPHNDDAVCAFLRTAMGELEQRCPGVRLRIIGKGASDTLLTLAARYPSSVTIEGFVDDLDTVFSRATVVLAPLRFGSGVKIKMLEALARGVPVLATTTAAEGIPVAADRGDGCLIEDDLARWPVLLAELVDAGSAADLSAGALAFFARTYGRDVVIAQYDALFGL
ncbi:MAG: glycosyltransferase family 4 protein, partial [Pseudonocardiaceae bacterium]